MNALIQLNYPRKYLLCLFISIILSEITFGQAPNIRSDSSFALFTAAGDISNNGLTVIWGDVGTYVGSYTGSPTVTGNIHVADSVSEQAAQDVKTAYLYMNGLSCDSTIDTPFGDNLVLLSDRVYCLTSTSVLNGELILDAQGNSNGIFIIKINGALSTNPNSNIILKNSASFNNVYWQVGGAVDLGENSTFKGTIIADGAISLMNSASIQGRGLTRAGAISLNNNQVERYDALGVSLPVNLLSFKAQSIGETIQLNWTTASETNNDYFTIQRSNDAVSFQDIFRVQGARNSNNIHHYLAIDQQPFDGAIFYRLMQTDFDGTSTFSEIIVVNFKKSFPFTIYPNPFSTSTTFVKDDILRKMDNCELKIYNICGEKVMSVSLTERLTTLSTDILFPGIYLYKIVGNYETIQSGSLISK
ncbi:MAG: ice-binding family protein [Bacteroidota bacterium]